MTLITAVLVQTKVVSGISARSVGSGLTGPDWSQEAAIVLLSFQSAGQIVASRALGFNEIPTVVITSLLCDLVSDSELFVLRNGKRDRRVAAFVLTLVGAIAGGWITRVTGDIVVVLWIAVGVKLAIMSVWLVWRGSSGSV